MTTSCSLRPTRPDIPFFLATDLDGTLIGDDQGMVEFLDFGAQHRRSFQLAYVTGEYFELVLANVDAGHILRPDYICANVGTEILDLNDMVNSLGRRYAEQVTPCWDLRRVYAMGQGPGVRMQIFPGGQPPYQAGFDWDGKAETLAALRARLAGCLHCRILPSSGRYIDVFPDGVGKGEAVRFLQRQLGFDPQRVVVAGDSGNDVEMFAAGYPGILPANALDELKQAANQPWHYHSPLPAARGVLDGLRHFGFVK
jgi:sucrose-6F-phosphate phosphohydrolase